jgi:hypothetical protein
MYQRCVAVTQPPLFVLRSAFWHSPPVNMRLQYACICYTFADGQSWRQGGPAVAQGPASLGIGPQQPREETATLRPGGKVLIGFLLATSPPHLYEGLCEFNLFFFSLKILLCSPKNRTFLQNSKSHILPAYPTFNSYSMQLRNAISVFSPVLFE